MGQGSGRADERQGAQATGGSIPTGEQAGQAPSAPQAGQPPPGFHGQHVSVPNVFPPVGLATNVPLMPGFPGAIPLVPAQTGRVQCP